jgi:hypothetical protein
MSGPKHLGQAKGQCGPRRRISLSIWQKGVMSGSKSIESGIFLVIDKDIFGFIESEILLRGPLSPPLIGEMLWAAHQDDMNS